MLMAKPQATARKPRLVLPFWRYRIHCEQPNSGRCLKPGQLPMQTATKAHTPLAPPCQKSLLPLCKMLATHTGVLLAPIFPVQETTPGHISTRPSLHHSSQENAQEHDTASCILLKASPWPAWLLGVSVQRRLHS